MSSAFTRLSVDSRFFSDTESYTSRQENKLALWQALCIEVSREDLRLADSSLG